VNAGHGQARLGHVGGQHDAAVLRGLKDAVLFGFGEATIQRQNVEQFTPPSTPAECLGDLADFLLGGQEDEDIAVAFAAQLVDGIADERWQVDLVFVLDDGRAVADFNGIGASGDEEDGAGAGVRVEC
jgi:hypothetical protein